MFFAFQRYSDQEKAQQQKIIQKVTFMGSNIFLKMSTTSQYDNCILDSIQLDSNNVLPNLGNWLQTENGCLGEKNNKLSRGEKHSLLSYLFLYISVYYCLLDR